MSSVALVAIAEVSVEELAAAVDARARLYDVREPDEYVEGHVPGAVAVPLGTVADHVGLFRSADDPVYVICRSGGRSLRACELLADHGVEAINVVGGTLAWQLSGREVVGGDQPW